MSERRATAIPPYEAGDCWQRRRSEVATRIENAALALFTARGFEAVTVEDIAAEAGMSRRTFYRYFDSPDAILCAVLCRSMALWSEVVRARPTVLRWVRRRMPGR